jgi:hypothetical protein
VHKSNKDFKICLKSLFKTKFIKRVNLICAICVRKIKTKILETQQPPQNKIMAWLKRLGWAGFFFFLIKGVTLYIVLPYLIAKGVISCEK